MKKIVLLALLFAAVAGSAQAATYIGPTPYRVYECTYSNPTMNEKSPGYSIFEVSGTDPIRGIEKFEAHYGGSIIWDNRKVTFAKPVNLVDYYGSPFTRWELTVNPYGPQCTRTDVRYNGLKIEFKNCSDGHSRTCWRLD